MKEMSSLKVGSKRRGNAPGGFVISDIFPTIGYIYTAWEGEMIDLLGEARSYKEPIGHIQK